VIHPWTTLPFEIFNLAFLPTEADRSTEVRRTRRPATTAEQPRVIAGVVPRADHPQVVNLQLAVPQGDVAAPGHPCEEAENRLCREMTVRYLRGYLLRPCLLSGHFHLLSREWST
jgi:hypothetical protein